MKKMNMGLYVLLAVFSFAAILCAARAGGAFLLLAFIFSPLCIHSAVALFNGWEERRKVEKRLREPFFSRPQRSSSKI